jgi:hypothetical protein
LLTFIKMLNVIRNADSPSEIGASIKNLSDTYNLEQLIEECENAAATLTDNYFPLIWRSYRTHRSTLFRLIKSLSFASTNQDQEKAIKYNTLIADMVIFQNVIDQTRVIQNLLDEGYQITENELKALSPYLTKHIKRFGEYVIDLNISPPSLELEYNFSLTKKR